MEDPNILSFDSIMAQLKHQDNIRERQQLEKRIQELSTITQEIASLKPGRRIYIQAQPGHIFFLDETAKVASDVKKEHNNKDLLLKSTIKDIDEYNKKTNKQKR